MCFGMAAFASTDNVYEERKEKLRKNMLQLAITL